MLLLLKMEARHLRLKRLYAKQSVMIKNALCERSIKEIENLAEELSKYKGIKN